MDVSSELLFFFSALGAFNGLFLGLYYGLFKKPKHLSNFFLGGLLISLSIRIGKSVIFYFNHDLAYGFLQFGLTACFFIGPFLYFYFKSIYDKKENISKIWKLNLLVLIPVILFINLKFPFEHNIDLWRPYIIYIIYSVWIGYSLFALPYIIRLIRPQSENSSSLGAQGLWDLSIYIGNLLIWAAFFFCGFTSYILGALLFSFMFYLLILQLIFRKRNDFSASKQQEKYKDKKIEDQKAEKIVLQLKEHFEKSNAYTNSNLKLADVAKSINLPSHILSQVLNDNLGKSFPQYLNELRIEAAKEIILKNEDLTLESIGYDCGFNSKSTFFSTFKKLVGVTPSVFQKQGKTRDTGSNL